MTNLEQACPFCGSVGKYLYREIPFSKWRHRIVCASTACGMEGPVEATKHEAIEAWNNRSDASEPEGSAS